MGVDLKIGDQKHSGAVPYRNVAYRGYNALQADMAIYGVFSQESPVSIC